MPPKKIKLPISTNPKPTKSTPKPPTSLTNEEYSEIFDAVINKQEPSHQSLNFKSPLVGKSPQVDALTPKECASLENSQNTNSEKPNDDIPKKPEKIKNTPTTKKAKTERIVSSNKPKQVHSENSNQSESVSTVHSEEFRKNAASSTPVIKKANTEKKQKSFREAVKNLKDTESQLSESLLGTLSQAKTSLNNSLMVDVPLSQPPANLNHRERLLWLQARRGENVFVQCDSCDKWRLSDVQDPLDLPNKWYCYMNKDVNFNNCSIPEIKLSIYVEADLIVNQYTAGSLVWAKIYSYPWWPAMVDDDPDTEQYYWIEDYDLNIPTAYNVTFFDGKNEHVTRAWITVKNLIPFKHNLNLDKKNGPAKYKSRLRSAKEQALEALTLTIKERLSVYSFISKTKNRINTPVPTPVHSASEDEMNDNSKTKKNRRSTVNDPVEQLKNTFWQKSIKALESLKNAEQNEAAQHTKATKKVTKRRSTSVMGLNEQIDKEELEKTFNTNKNQSKIQQRRKSIPGRLPERDSSQDSNEPKKVTRRRNIRVDTSIETERSISQESTKEQKVTKRRKTISEYESQDSKESIKSAIDQDSSKLEKGAKPKIQRRRKSIPARLPEKDSSQDTNEPQKVTRRRNTRVDTSIERDSSFSQDSTKEQKITKRRKTISEYESQASKESFKSAVGQDSSELEKGGKQKIQRRRKSIPGRVPERDSSQDTNEPKKVTRRRNTRVNTSIETDRSISQESTKEKKNTKPGKTVSENESQASKESLKSAVDQYSSELEKSAKTTNARGRKPIPDRLPQRDSSQDISEPKKVTRRRNTRVNTSIETERSISQDSTKKEKTTKSRTNIEVTEMQTSSKAHTSVIDQNSNNVENGMEENKIQRRRSSIFEKNPQKDSSQELQKPTAISRRRNTRADTSIEQDSSFSQDLTKESSTITKSSRDSQNTVERRRSRSIPYSQRDSSQNSNTSENDINICDTSVERESSYSEGSTKCNRITKRRTTIGKHELKKSEGSQKAIEEDLKVPSKLGNEKEAKTTRRRSSVPKINSQRDSSQNSDASEKISKLSEYTSQDSKKPKSRNSQQKVASNSQSDKDNKIKQRRNTVHDKNSQISDETQKITKRRNTLVNTVIERENSSSKDTIKKEKITTHSQNSVESQKTIKERNSQQIEEIKSGNESTRRGNSIRENDSQRDSSQTSEKSRNITKRRNTPLDPNIEKENTSSQGSKNEKKITKRRKTIGEYNYQTLNKEQSENTNIEKPQDKKISNRRNTTEIDSSFRSDTALNKRRNKFVSPLQNTEEANRNIADDNRFNESQCEPKKYRKTLGARKIVSTNKLKNIKGVESGYESAISVKKNGKNLNLSIISEESSSNLDISNKSDTPKKRRQTTDEEMKKLDGTKKSKDKHSDEEPEITFMSLSQSLEQFDAEKRKKKFMAICQEIVNIDKDPEDPTISEEEKIFYEKLNSSLKQVKEKHLHDDKLKKNVENRLEEAEFNGNKNISKNEDYFKPPIITISNNPSTVTSANTSMQSDFSESEIQATEKKKLYSSAFELYDFREKF